MRTVVEHSCALEQRLHEVDHPIFYWLVEHTADVSTKFQKGVDRHRIFAEVAEDPDMKCEVEAHESRKMKYLEAAVEQEDQRMRRLGWTQSGSTYEADPKHVRIMLEEWSMTSCNNVVSPG